MNGPELRLAEAISLATAAHQGQTRREEGAREVPYILHPLRVMLAISAIHPWDYEAMIVAVTHDVLEDTEVILDQIRHLYSEEGAAALVLLTRERGQDLTYADYIRRIATSGNPIAISVKVADLQDNLKGATQDRWKKYHLALKQLWKTNG